MAYQSIFKRYEMKYLMTKDQKRDLLKTLDEYMAIDDYGRTKISSLYFDTPDFRLIRRSIEKPSYKEKLRLRSYGDTNANTPVYVELKKKMDKVVYKRRIGATEKEAMKFLCNQVDCLEDTQIKKEIAYTFECYEGLQPMVYLSYEREAYYSKEDTDFRVTFDDKVLWRNEEVDLCKGAWGNRVIPENMVIMEVKTAKGLPLWFSHFLSSRKIYKQGFSKYGAAYKMMMADEKQGGRKYA